MIASLCGSPINLTLTESIKVQHSGKKSWRYRRQHFGFFVLRVYPSVRRVEGRDTSGNLSCTRAADVSDCLLEKMWFFDVNTLVQISNHGTKKRHGRLQFAKQLGGHWQFNLTLLWFNLWFKVNATSLRVSFRLFLSSDFITGTQIWRWGLFIA